MGVCRYCGKPAGIFRRKHAECADAHRRVLVEIDNFASQAACGALPLDALEAKIKDAATGTNLTPIEIRTAYVDGWETESAKLVKCFEEKGAFDGDEERKLLAYQERFHLTQAELDTRGSYMRLVKLGVLNDLMNGKASNRLTVTGTLPFNFQPTEHLIWLFQNVGSSWN